MKKICNLLLLSAVCIHLFTGRADAQCGVGYTQAQTNWDNLDYYFNSAAASPYASYISDAREMSQKFGIGTTYVTIATSSNALVNPGTGGTVTNENATHTGDLAGYTGHDVQYNPSANGQTITITFDTPVLNAAFTLYDIDLAAVITVTAADPLAAPLVVAAATQPGTILTVAGAPGKVISDLTNAGAGTALGNASNLGSATITVAGTALTPVKTITITCTTIGTDAVFWLSDISACVTGSFPTSWHQGYNNQPFQGSTQNEPDYFLVTPDNNSCYMMDPATGRCWWLFTDASKTYMNSYAYDPENKFLYYISENSSLDANNKALKKYDFNTETISTVIADIGTTLGIPTFNSGVESAAGAFYNGKLYMGVEGGQSSTTIRESMVWCIDLATNTAYQLFSTPSYDGGGIVHDWADMLVKNGELVNYNSARRGANYSYSSYTHFDMMTGVATRYNNPSSTVKYSGQAGLNWSGTMYMIYDSVYVYNAGVISSPYRPVVQTVPGDPVPPAWAGNAGDGSDPFRPKSDFGDAPATYDPVVVSPAVHERSEAIRLGATWTKEWLKTGVTGNNDSDDGNSYVNFLPQGSGNYLAYTYVTNNYGSNATLIAWLDYNGNGVFDASEACAAQTIPTGTNNVLYWLYWPSFSTPLLNGQTTYMRIRITAATAGMTSAHATGYFINGEVEDYPIPVDNYPLSVTNLSFNASILNNSVAKLDWSCVEQPGFSGYEIQKSSDAANWNFAGITGSNGQTGEQQYQFVDNNLTYGTTYYRLKLVGVNGTGKFSETRSVRRLRPDETITVKPNPVRTIANVTILANSRTDAEIVLLTETGKQLYFSKLAVTSGYNNLSIPVKADWPSGVYLLRVFMNNETITKKILIGQ
ncbi:MAG: GEVED domain-containing protein [Bacteroidota bacterium]